MREFLQWFGGYAIFELLLTFIVGVVLTTIFFTTTGENVIGILKLRGGEIVSSKQLAQPA
ncbi:MAG: hypothetical protein RCG15_00685 [Candidatus Rickettsia vulgarisii]